MISAKYLRMFVGVFLAIVGSTLPARAQDQGPMAPPPKFEVNRIPSVPHPGPPPIPADEIIRRFAANEDAAKKVYDSYDFNQTVRIDELAEIGGKFSVSGQEYTRPDGQRFWRVVQQPQSTLIYEKYSMEQVRPVVTMPLFFLTSDELANYNFVYAGQQKLDDLNTYVFQVKPKLLSRTRRFFQGVIFVDDHDLAIVETFGKFLIDAYVPGDRLPFDLFEIYRENFQEKYWLPTYISSDAYIDATNGQLHLRLVIHSTDFKLYAPPAATADAPSALPSPGPDVSPPAPVNPAR